MAESGNPKSIALKVKWMIENSSTSELIANSGYNKAKELLDYDQLDSQINSIY